MSLSTRTPNSGAANALPGKHYRRPATGAAQAKRVAWGHKYGPLVGAAIRNAIKEHGTR